MTPTFMIQNVVGDLEGDVWNRVPREHCNFLFTCSDSFAVWYIV